MKAAVFAVAALLLVGPALGYVALGDNGMVTYSGRGRESNTLVFGNEVLLQRGFDATMDMFGDLLTGTFKPNQRPPASPKKELNLTCLNSIAPPPLNWPMWCPGKDAKIVEWTDNHGALHRQITMRPMHNVTSTMVIWFGSVYLSGMLPPVVEFEGNLYNYYHLWHPLDHIEHAWALGPAIPPFQIGNMYTLIHERYRNPIGFPYNTNYETNGWFFLQDPIGNMMRNRFYIMMPLMGLPTWNMVIELNDTPEGLVVDIEIILGIPPKGFDERDPTAGYFTAAALNELLTAPLIAQDLENPEFTAVIDGLTRHAIEEFGNLRFFAPVLYEKYNIMGKLGVNWIPSPQDWMQHAQNRFPLDTPALSLYDALAAIAQLQLDKSNTTYAAAVNSLVAASKSSFKSALDIAAIASTANSLVYTVPSNAVTTAAREINAASGARPDADISVQKLARAAVGGDPNAFGTPWYLSWFTRGRKL